MPGPDGRENVRVGILQNGDTFYMDTAGMFTFVTTAFTGAEMLAYMRNLKNINTAGTRIGQGAGSTVFSIINMLSTHRMITLSATSTCVDASFWLCSVPEIGRELLLVVARGSCASGRVWVSTSGCSLVGLWGSAISGFYLYNSAASSGRIRLIASGASEWSVLEANTSYAE